VELGLQEIGEWGKNIIALVKKNNPASIRVFETLGFTKNENEDFIEFKIQIR
jgi:L-amino acid N-acyltransferase YncA